MYEITVKTYFSGAHFLRQYQGKCENLHGHNWLVEATLSGDSLNEAGMLYDFKDLKTDLEKIIDELDHTLLNDHPEFRTENPSAERIARMIFLKLKDSLKDKKVELKEICVHESESSKAVYRQK